jgi:hypothetical protein
MYTITTLLYIMEAHNTIIYPVCLYNVFLQNNCQKLHILLAGELINELTALYKAIRLFWVRDAILPTQ